MVIKCDKWEICLYTFVNVHTKCCIHIHIVHKCFEAQRFNYKMTQAFGNLVVFFLNRPE